MAQENWIQKTAGLVDLLRTAPVKSPFSERVAGLNLSACLEKKILSEMSDGKKPHYLRNQYSYPGEWEEKELGTEVLLCRHQFTEIVFGNQVFRQAALSVVQNIYLFQNRKIFFGTTGSIERERQDAIMLLTNGDTTVPLAKTFQHLIIARVWNRIISQSTDELRERPGFKSLHEVVEKLNTLRNIYMVLSAGLVRKLVGNVSEIYKQSISHEDALQIGSFGVARAAYRYHHSCGVRFSTYAANWIRKEIQRQSLKNRLVRISSNSVELFSRAVKTGDVESLDRLTATISEASKGYDENGGTIGTLSPDHISSSEPGHLVESKQASKLLNNIVDKVLEGKSADIIRRRYGLQPYGREQSVVEIGMEYGVTRSSIYQVQQLALKKLKNHMALHEIDL